MRARRPRCPWHSTWPGCSGAQRYRARVRARPQSPAAPRSPSCPTPRCAVALPPTRKAPPFRAQRTARAQVCAGPSLALGHRAAVLGRLRRADPRRPYGALRHDPGRARQQAPTSTLSCIVQYNIAVCLWEAAAETRAAAAAATACVVAEPGPEPRPGRGSRVAVRRFPGSRRGQPPEHAQSPLPRQQSEQRRPARRTFKQHCPAGACTVRCGGVPDSGGARCGTTLVCPSNRGVRHPRRNQKLGAACWVGGGAQWTTCRGCQ